MNLSSPAEFVESYTATGEKKANSSISKLFLLGLLAGSFIAFASAASSTAAFGSASVATARLISGLIFPFGLVMVVLTGSELFTGNCLITITVMERRTSILKMLRNLVIVYLGNLVGSLLIAVGCAYCGQFNYAGGELAVYTIKVAAAKCALSFGKALVSGIFCNLLVCTGVMMALSAKDLIGRAAGAYIPVCFFVICGFEHCVANMYYIPAGLFANSISKYAALASEKGIDISALSWGNFLSTNLLPVTLGNLIGGILFALVMWFGHKQFTKEKVRVGTSR